MLMRFTDNIIMQLTRDCNLHCSYCFQGDKSPWHNKMMSFEDFKTFVDTTLYERCVLGDKDNLVDFHFHGGEVLLLGTEEIIKRMEYLFKRREFFRGIRITLQTNGTLINEKLAKYFYDHDLVIGVSFDGWKNDRQSKEQTRKMMENLKNLHDRIGTKFGLLSTITKNNVKTWFSDCKELVPWTEGLGVNIICTHQKEDYLIPSPEEIEEYVYMPVLKTWLTDKPIEERDLKVATEYILEDMIFQVEPSIKKTGCFDQYCGHLTNMIAVLPDLTLTGCDKYLEFGDYVEEKRKYYNLFQKDFLGLNQIQDYFNFCKEVNKARIQQGCDSCPMQIFCPGECQSYALSKYGKVVMPEKSWCRMYEHLYDFILEHWIEIILHQKFRTTHDVLSVRNDIKYKLNQAGIQLKYDPCTRTYKGERK